MSFIIGDCVSAQTFFCFDMCEVCGTSVIQGVIELTCKRNVRVFFSENSWFDCELLQRNTRQNAISYFIFQL